MRPRSASQTANADAISVSSYAPARFVMRHRPYELRTANFRSRLRMRALVALTNATNAKASALSTTCRRELQVAAPFSAPFSCLYRHLLLCISAHVHYPETAIALYLMNLVNSHQMSFTAVLGNACVACEAAVGTCRSMLVKAVTYVTAPFFHVRVVP